MGRYMDYSENYVYKKEVDWSLLTGGITLPLEHQVVFAHNMGRFLQRGESKEITILIGGIGYKAIVRNIKFNPKFNRKKDTFQIKFRKELKESLQTYFHNSYGYIKDIRVLRPKNDRSIIRLPDNQKEYLAIYTTEKEDTFIAEPIVSDEVRLFYEVVNKQSERVIEDTFNYDVEDNTSTIILDKRTTKIRKLNRKIGENLKLLYGYRCQICGCHIGERYNAHVVEAHHIDYFTKSLNNNSSNLLILCPNHHSIIHDVNPSFDRKKLVYLYPNGYKEGLVINKHL